MPESAYDRRAGIPYRDDVIRELDQENARLHGELIDVRAELAATRHQLVRLVGALRTELEKL